MKEDRVRIPGLKDKRRYDTQKNQREARTVGTVHPRSLARSVTKSHCRANGIPENECGKYFRKLFDVLPKNGRKNLYNEAERANNRIIRRILK